MSLSGRFVPISGLCHSFLVLLIFCFLVQAQDCSQSKPCSTGCCSKFGYCGTGSDFCGAGNCVANCDFKLGCDANNPCKSGCCSKFGFCGLGPDYCSPQNCVAGCDSKAYCDPGGYGQYAQISTCPLNVCCSKWGFCGITPEFCGTKKVNRPSTAQCPSHTLKRVVGYYEGWAKNRACNKFVPELIPLGVYTHLNYAFATIDPVTFEVRPASPADQDLMVRLTSLKRRDPDLKVFIAIGGWTFNDPGPTQTTFSDIARNNAAQQSFIKSLLSFMVLYDFDGVDIDWEYPEADDRSGRPEDFANFPRFIQNLKAAMQTNNGRDGLSITLPVSYWYLQHFDIKQLVKYVDFFNMMSYDLHGTWDANSKWLGAYLNAHTNLTEITDAMDLLWRNDIPPAKVVLGTAFYGRAFTASSTSCTQPGCAFSSGARAGPCSNEVSVLLNSEIVDITKSRGISPVWDRNAAVKLLTFDSNQWVAYDDADTFKQKADFARSQCMGGIMVWAVSHDTSDGQFSRAIASVAQRSVVALASNSGGGTTSKTLHNQCQWSGCGEKCPAGWIRMMRDDKWRKQNPEPMRDNTGCGNLDPPRELCCPADTAPSSCGWYSHNNGKCAAGCPSDYVEVGSMSVACKYGSQTACCKKGADSLKLYEQCTWGCDKGYKCTNTEVADSLLGSGGQKCKKWEDNGSPFQDEVTYSQKYCCSQSDTTQWSECDWYKVGFIEAGRPDGFCPGGCPDGKVRVALDESSSMCPAGGRRARCCTPNYTTITKRSDDPQLGEWEAALRFWVNDPTCPADSLIWNKKRDLAMGNATSIEASTSSQPLGPPPPPQRPVLAAMGTIGSALDLIPHPADLIRREFSTQKLTEYYLMKEIAMRIFDGYSATSDLTNLWNNIVVGKFPGLYATWLQGKVNRDLTTRGWSLDMSISDFLCRMQHYSDEASRGSPAVSCVCTRQDCCLANDIECQTDSSEAMRRRDPTATETFEITYTPNNTHSAAKRGASETYSVQGSGQSWNTRSLPYRSPSQLNQNDPIRGLAYQRTTSNDCTVTDPDRTNAVQNVHQVEHVVERQTVLMNFFNDALAGRMPDGSTPRRASDLRTFTPAFMTFLNSPTLNNPPPVMMTTWWYDNRQPTYRIAHALGDMTNTDPFTMLQNALNNLKSRMFRRGVSLWGVPTINAFLASNSYVDGAMALQNALTTIEYHNVGPVNQRLIAILNAVRSELLRAENQWNSDPANANQQQTATLWWDYWVRAEYRRAVQQVRSEVDSLAQRLLNQFGNDPNAVGDINRLRTRNTLIDIFLAGLIVPFLGL